MSYIKVQDRRIGDGYPCFIIAEAGINHNGDVEEARDMVAAAAKAGTDAIKFQTHFPEHEMLRYGATAGYVGESLFDLLTRTSLAGDQHVELKELADKLGIIFLSTAFSREAADFLNWLNVPAFKVGSGELTNIPLLEHIARKNKPMIISTGMATEEEIQDTLRHVYGLNIHLAIMHCTSTYPTPYEHANLRYIQRLKEKYLHFPVGLSDHTIGSYTAFAAIPLGANLIEKHFTLSRNLPGPDQKASIEPDELCDLVEGIRAIEQALGDEKNIQPGEEEVQKMARHSVVSVRRIACGKVIDAKDVWVKRPGTGIAAKYLEDVIGRKTKRPIPKDILIVSSDLE